MADRPNSQSPDTPDTVQPTEQSLPATTLYGLMAQASEMNGYYRIDARDRRVTICVFAPHGRRFRFNESTVLTSSCDLGPSSAAQLEELVERISSALREGFLDNRSKKGA